MYLFTLYNVIYYNNKVNPIILYLPIIAANNKYYKANIK